MVNISNWIVFTTLIVISCLCTQCQPTESAKAKQPTTAPVSEVSEPILSIKDIQNQEIALQKLKSFQYDSLHKSDIMALESLMKTEAINASDTLNQLTKGTIIVYKTSKSLYGKMQILQEGHQALMRTTNYNNDEKRAYQIVNKMTLNPMQSYDLDRVLERNQDRDFMWEPKTMKTRYLVPKNRAKFLVMTKNKE